MELIQRMQKKISYIFSLYKAQEVLLKGYFGIMLTGLATNL